MNKYCNSCGVFRDSPCSVSNCEAFPKPKITEFHDFRDYPVLPKYHRSWHNEVIYDESGAVIYKRNYQ